MHTSTAVQQHTRNRFDDALEELRAATIKEPFAQKLLGQIDVLVRSRAGIEYLYNRISTLIDAGIFAGTVWEAPDRLVPSLVGGTLRAGPPTATIEVVSELRMLAFANGDIASERITQDNARDFLEKVLTENLSVIFGEQTEEGRINRAEARATEIARELFQVILDHIPLDSIKHRLAEEVEMIAAQRPISTGRVREILRLIRERFTLNDEDAADRRLAEFLRAVGAPTDAIAEHPDHAGYRRWLRSADSAAIEREARLLGESMNSTGVVCEHHAVFLHEVIVPHHVVLADALGLDAAGAAELAKHRDSVLELVEAAIFPSTAQSIYGLSRLLKRGLLSRQPVEEGLYRLMSARLDPQVRKNILRGSDDGRDLPAKQLLIAGTIGVLGQPLGIGQGMNPTCQAARGISLWSQHAPGKLLAMIITAAETNNLDYHFEGKVLLSKDLQLGLAKELDYDLDPVSIVLVPHLDRIYNEMMRRASIRGEDPHKFVNPALYGHWIQTGFCSAFNYITQSITNYGEFVRTFYASHHPDYNGGHNLIYPNPVGIFITSSHGVLLGFHAVSLLRVDRGPGGAYRAYFLNPNNEGRQDWGQGIKPTVFGNGEVAGESSLPFHEFAARLYAFHYNELNIADREEIDPSEVARVERLARESWGTAYVWM